MAGPVYHGRSAKVNKGQKKVCGPHTSRIRPAYEPHKRQPCANTNQIQTKPNQTKPSADEPRRSAAARAGAGTGREQPRNGSATANEQRTSSERTADEQRTSNGRAAKDQQRASRERAEKKPSRREAQQRSSSENQTAHHQSQSRAGARRGEESESVFFFSQKKLVNAAARAFFRFCKNSNSAPAAPEREKSVTKGRKCRKTLSKIFILCNVDPKKGRKRPAEPSKQAKSGPRGAGRGEVKKEQIYNFCKTAPRAREGRKKAPRRLDRSGTSDYNKGRHKKARRGRQTPAGAASGRQAQTLPSQDYSTPPPPATQG